MSFSKNSGFVCRNTAGLLVVVVLVMTSLSRGWAEEKSLAPATTAKESVAVDAAHGALSAAELPVVVPSPGTVKLAEAQAEVAAYVAEKCAADPALRALDERIKALGEELSSLSVKRSEELSKDPKYRELLERQAEALKIFRLGK